MNFKQWIIDLFKDERGSASVKPVVAFMGAFVLNLCCLLNIWFTLVPAQAIIDAIVWITIVGMGADVLDKFSFKNKATASTSQENTTSITSTSSKSNTAPAENNIA